MPALPNSDPELYFAEDGAPRSGRFGDIYYSLQDGLAESRAVFLAGCGLPQMWSGRNDFTVLELGFGTGLNIAALMAAWAADRPAGRHLHIFSVEGFLMSSAQAAQALSAWPELATFAKALIAQWPKARRGWHYMDFPQWGISLTLALMDVRDALTGWTGQADAVFLDGFSPALNPDMWADDVLHLVGERTAPGGRLATFTVAGFVRRGLAEAGFSVSKQPGFGRKRERLEAVRQGQVTTAVRPGRIAIIGAGIAGCALVYQARLYGLECDLFDSEGRGSGASGNPAALVTPRLDAGDNAISGLFADAFVYATSLYANLCPQAVIGRGVFQAESGERDAGRFDRIVLQDRFATGDLERLATGQAPVLPNRAGIQLTTAMVVQPQDVLDALLGGVAIRSEAVIAVEANCVITPSGRIEGYDAVVFAGGEGIFDLTQDYDLRPVRGQVETLLGVQGHRACSWGGYAAPSPDGLVIGATHDRDDRGRDIRATSREVNLASLAEVLPQVVQTLDDGNMRSRASIRVMSRDYLPLAGQTGTGVYILSGLGARGFCLAPLLARAVISEILGLGSALPGIAKKLLLPDRLKIAV